MSVALTKTSHRLMLDGPRRLAWDEYARPHPGIRKPHEVLIRSELSAIKHGTEGVYYSGESPFHDSEFDPRSTLFGARAEVGHSNFVGHLDDARTQAFLREEGAGPLQDLGVHAIDLGLMLTGGFDQVSG